jgi:hypothetical protein
MAARGRLQGWARSLSAVDHHVSPVRAVGQFIGCAGPRIASGYRDKFLARPVGISDILPQSARIGQRRRWISRASFSAARLFGKQESRRLIEVHQLQHSARELPPLVLIGPCPPGYFKDVIGPAVARSPNPANIVIAGHVSEGVLAWAFANARMLVQPSFAEGFSSFSVFQAMQQGVPVACANTTSHPEAVGEAALLFDPSSVPAIAAAMERLLDDAQERAQLAAAGARRVAELSWSANAERVCAEISKIIGASRERVQ